MMQKRDRSATRADRRSALREAGIRPWTPLKAVIREFGSVEALAEAIIGTRVADECIDKRISEAWQVGNAVEHIGRYPADVDFARASSRTARDRPRQLRKNLLSRLVDAARAAVTAAQLDTRLNAIIDLKTAVDEAIDYTHNEKKRKLRHCLVMIKWAAQLQWAEEMAPNQLQGLLNATEILRDSEMTEVLEDRISSVLLEYDLDYIPDLGASDTDGGDKT